jgi:hypothetical protein
MSTAKLKKRLNSSKSEDFSDVDDAIFELEAGKMIYGSEDLWKLTSTGLHAAKNEEILEKRRFKFQIASYFLGLISGTVATLFGSVLFMLFTSILP